MSSKETSLGTSNSKPESETFALRPNLGQNGKLIEIISNHFPIKYNPNLIVFHYDIGVEPIHNVHQIGDELSSLTISDESADFRADESKKRFRKLNNKFYRVIFEEALKQHSGENQIFNNVLPIFDGLKNLYSAKEIPVKDFALLDIKSTTSSSSDESKLLARVFVDVVEDGHNVKYAVMLKLASRIDMNSLDMYYRGIIKQIPHECLQVLNILLRHGPTLYKIPIGNSLYSTWNESLDRRTDIGGGRQLAYGHFQSVRPLVGGVNLVVDRTCTALYEFLWIPRFIATILQMDRNQFESLSHFSDSQRTRIKKELVGLQVQVRHLTYKRKYKVIDISMTSAQNTTFEVKKMDPRGRVISLGIKTVIDFFQDTYPDTKIVFSYLPCLMVGSNKNPNYLPLDICELVPDQSVRKNLTADQTAQMIRESASQLPQQRLSIIRDSTQEICIESQPYLNEFGVEMARKNDPIKIDGRVLEAPELGYASNRSVKPKDGKWDLKYNNCHFFNAAHLQHWIIMFFNENGVQRSINLEREIISAGRRFGMTIAEATKRVKISANAEQIRNAFSRAKQVCDHKLQLIVFIIDPKIKYLYEVIKRIGDCEQRVVTQCIKDSNCVTIKTPLMNNIILKINTKLGGINAIIKDTKLLKRRTMFIGIDCSHPGVGERVATNSMTACVGSYDPNFVQYVAITRVQKRAQEINSELREMVVELLKVYASRNRELLPEQIIIYRDGVSEGQFDAALKSEILLLIEGFKAFRDGYQPLITFIVVQKRHHTRFFLLNERDGVGRAKNVPPGLVIDTDVVSKTHFDYFLCSHEGIQGTSRPTHYYVLWDTNNLSSDDLQKITFYLSHIYSRCNRSISCPTPVAYAHLAAYRAQRHIIGVRMHEESDTESVSSSAQLAEPRRHGSANYENELQIDGNYGLKMYFC